MVLCVPLKGVLKIIAAWFAVEFGTKEKELNLETGEKISNFTSASLHDAACRYVPL